MFQLVAGARVSGYNWVYTPASITGSQILEEPMMAAKQATLVWSNSVTYGAHEFCLINIYSTTMCRYHGEFEKQFSYLAPVPLICWRRTAPPGGSPCHTVGRSLRHLFAFLHVEAEARLDVLSLLFLASPFLFNVFCNSKDSLRTRLKSNNTVHPYLTTQYTHT